jgi:hypothetical protein
MVKSENNQGEIRRFANVDGFDEWHEFSGLTYVETAKMAVRKELERLRSDRACIWFSNLRFKGFSTFVLVRDYDEFEYRNIKVTVSLKFEFSTRPPGANE